MLPILSINGQMNASPHSGISPFDRGFMLGDGVFETMKVTNRTPWYLDRHLQRLQSGTQRLGIPYPPHIQEWITDVLQHPALHEDSDELALRVTVTRGVTLTPGLTTLMAEQPTSVIMTYHLPVVPKTVYERGLSAYITSAPRNERAFSTRIKTMNYTESIIALQEARAAGYDEAIFLDTNNFVSEATFSNVFAYLNGSLVTPSSTHGILPGITRAVVMEIAQRLEIPIAERELEREDLANADEAFLTSSLREIAPLVKLGHDNIGSGAPGPITRRLMKAYQALTNRI